MIQLVRSKNPLDPWEVSLQLRDGRGQMLERIQFPLSRLRAPAR
jgi:hypothetical protein